MDQASDPRARRGFQAVTQSLVEKGDSVIVSSLAHYTEFLAVEVAGGVVKEVPQNESHVITAEATRQKIEDVKTVTGKVSALIMIDHFDYQFANEHDVYGIARVAKEYGVHSCTMEPYRWDKTRRRQKNRSGLIVGSAHKSMAYGSAECWLLRTSGPRKVFRTTQMVGDVTKRKFGIKEVDNIGRTLSGWHPDLNDCFFPTGKSQDRELGRGGQEVQLLLRTVPADPGKQGLERAAQEAHFEQSGHNRKLRTVAKTHKRRGFFFSDELNDYGIIGEFAGATRTWKLNTYGLSWDQIKYTAESFIDIAEKYGLKIN